MELQLDEAEVTALLLDLLEQTAAAHGVHEKNDLSGKYDENWPQWYAAEMTRRLKESGVKFVRTT